MKLAAPQQAVNTEAEHAQRFIETLRQVSGSTSDTPAEPIAVPEAGWTPHPMELDAATLGRTTADAGRKCSSSRSAPAKHNQHPPDSSGSSSCSKTSRGIQTSQVDEAACQKDTACRQQPERKTGDPGKGGEQGTQGVKGLTGCQRGGGQGQEAENKPSNSTNLHQKQDGVP